jgi:hypothetical protein
MAGNTSEILLRRTRYHPLVPLALGNILDGGQNWCNVPFVNNQWSRMNRQYQPAQVDMSTLPVRPNRPTPHDAVGTSWPR